MVERLTEVVTCLDHLLEHQPEARLAQLRNGLQQALANVQADYTLLRQAGDWLLQLAAILDPDGQPPRTGAQVVGNSKPIWRRSSRTVPVRRACTS